MEAKFNSIEKEILNIENVFSGSPINPELRLAVGGGNSAVTKTRILSSLESMLRRGICNEPKTLIWILIKDEEEKLILNMIECSFAGIFILQRAY